MNLSRMNMKSEIDGSWIETWKLSQTLLPVAGSIAGEQQHRAYPQLSWQSLEHLFDFRGGVESEIFHDLLIKLVIISFECFFLLTGLGLDQFKKVEAKVCS